MSKIFLALLLPLLWASCGVDSPGQLPPRGPYLGQESPGMIPVVFAPGIVSTEEDELNAAFSPEGTELYFTVRRSGQYTLMTIRMEDDQWTERSALWFSGEYSDVDPVVSADGLRLYFSSRRPLAGEGSETDSNLWVSTRTEADTWSEPEHLGALSSPTLADYYTSISSDGTLYFSRFGAGGGSGDLFRSELMEGVYLEPERLAPPLNTDSNEHDPFVAPDGSYLIFTSNRAGGFGGGDLYVSFRAAEGTWSAPINMGAEINSPGHDYCGMVSPNGAYLFFTRTIDGEGDIYWVDARVIDALRGDGSVQDQDGLPPDALSQQAKEPAFPVEPELFLDGVFERSEGISFNGEGDLFVTANRALWKVDPDGSVTRLADLHSNLGLAPIGDRDLLVADFGPTNAFQDGPNRDGTVWRITPEGVKTVAATGIGDPNFVLVREDGSFLTSDDATDEIFLTDTDGTTRIFSRAVSHPNGMAFSLDGTTLFVAQIFTQINPTLPDDRVWAIPLEEDGSPAGPPSVVLRTGEGDANDGLAMDRLGRLYIAANGGNRILRFDPKTSETVVIAEGITAVASLAFGRGEFDGKTIFAASTFRGGGRIWKIYVGVEGPELHR
jgi:sugar lactone lactonase YvrE